MSAVAATVTPVSYIGSDMSLCSACLSAHLSQGGTAPSGGQHELHLKHYTDFVLEYQYFLPN